MCLVQFHFCKQWDAVKVKYCCFNTENTKCMVLGFKHLLKVIPSLHVTTGGTDIKQVTEAKLFWITVDSNMSWNGQTDQMMTNMGRSVAVVKCCRKFMSTCFMKRSVQAFVLTQLDHCSVIWSNTTKNNLKR